MSIKLQLCEHPVIDLSGCYDEDALWVTKIIQEQLPPKLRHQFLIQNGWRLMGQTETGNKWHTSWYANMELVNAPETFTQIEAVTLTVWFLLSLTGKISLTGRPRDWWNDYRGHRYSVAA